MRKIEEINGILRKIADTMYKIEEKCGKLQAYIFILICTNDLVHPHVRGEYGLDDVAIKYLSGSSPRALTIIHIF